ncbi:MAG: hypothetical protein ACPL0C_07180 [Candidatus Bathyarchaeales archaeon]
MKESLHPYVVFLPSEEKGKILHAIFGSKAAFDILKSSLKQGISKEIYQKDLVQKLPYSNKTIIENLKTLTNLGIVEESMKKIEKAGRTTWVKTYTLSDVGKWFALLIAEEKDLSQKEKADILQTIFRTYVKWVKDLSEKLHVDKNVLTKIFMKEIQ